MEAFCDYRPVEVPAALTPVPTPSAPACAPRRRRAELEALNTAFVEIADDRFEHIKAILGLSRAEEESVYAVLPAKRRKLKALFPLLAENDADLQKLAQTAISDDAEDVSSVSSQSLATPQPCICGKKVGSEERSANESHAMAGKKMVDGKKMVRGKMVFDMAGKKVVM